MVPDGVHVPSQLFLCLHPRFSQSHHRSWWRRDCIDPGDDKTWSQTPFPCVPPTRLWLQAKPGCRLKSYLRFLPESFFFFFPKFGAMIYFLGKTQARINFMILPKVTWQSFFFFFCQNLNCCWWLRPHLFHGITKISRNPQLETSSADIGCTIWLQTSRFISLGLKSF